MIRSNVCSRSVDEGHVYEKFGVPHQRSRVTWVMDHTLSAVILASKLKLAVSQEVSTKCAAARALSGANAHIGCSKNVSCLVFDNFGKCGPIF